MFAAGVSAATASCTNGPADVPPPAATRTPQPPTEEESAAAAAVDRMRARETAVVEDEAERLALQEALVERLKNSPWSNRFNGIEVRYMNISHPGEEYSQRVATGESGNPNTREGLMLRWLPVPGVPETAICPIMEGARFQKIKYRFRAVDKLTGQEVEYLLLGLKDLGDNPYVDAAFPGGARAIDKAGETVNGCVFLCQREGDYVYTRNLAK